jgi:hypothetical protein
MKCMKLVYDGTVEGGCWDEKIKRRDILCSEDKKYNK